MVKPFSLNTKERLHTQWDYQKFLKGSERISTPFGVVYRIPNELGYPRLGLTVKNSQGSVKRNLMKRALREGFRRSKGFLGCFDYNFVVSTRHKFDDVLAEIIYKWMIENLPHEVKKFRTYV